jgi:hypothetical protein
MIEERRQVVASPFFSVCIPQHNRTSFLLAVCRSLEEQTFRGFEVCISDDHSDDGRQDELLEFLRHSNLSFVYRALDRNLRYDANLRSSIEMARGRFAFLLGNDDALNGPATLQRVHDAIVAGPEPAVALTNFEDFATGRLTRRVRRTALVGSGPELAAAVFRKFSFVGGVVVRTAGAQALGDNAWDGSEMHQMFIACRMIAAGGRLLEVDCSAVRKDVQIAGERVESYASRPAAALRGIPEQRLPLLKTAMLVADAIEPHITARRQVILLKIITQYLGFVYPYWLVQYRKVQSWRFAAGLSRGMRPASSLSSIKLSWFERTVARVVYLVSTVVGLTVPVSLLDRLQVPAREVARRVAEWRTSASSP